MVEFSRGFERVLDMFGLRIDKSNGFFEGHIIMNSCERYTNINLLKPFFAFFHYEGFTMWFC